MGLLAGLHVHAVQPVGIPDQVGLLSILCSYAGPIAGLCTHLWLGEDIGFIP